MAKTFGATSTTDEVLSGINLKGKRILVTGVSAGIGVETARSLAAHGAHVIGAARDLKKAETATTQIRKDAAASGGSLELIELDLGNLKSVRAAADKLIAKGEPLDIIIANAGVMATPFGKTADGFETQFGTNHLGHFVFVNRIAPLLRSGGRLVNVSSAGHRYSERQSRRSRFRKHSYDPFVAYGRSKTANILFAVEFDKRHRARGVRATAIHPGVIKTELARYIDPGRIEKLIQQINENLKAEGKGPFQWKISRARRRDFRLGCGYGRCRRSRREVLRELPRRKPMRRQIENIAAVSEGVRAYALDPANADALWKKSEELVGETFPAIAARTA